MKTLINLLCFSVSLKVEKEHCSKTWTKWTVCVKSTRPDFI